MRFQVRSSLLLVWLAVYAQACADDGHLLATRPSAPAGGGASGLRGLQPPGSGGTGAPPQAGPAAGAPVSTNAGMPATVAGSSATAVMPPPMPMLIDQTGSDNPAGLSPAEVIKLTSGGPRADMKWLYPYEGTVFPGGTIAPLVMWTGNAAPDAVYLHMKSQLFEYKGALKPTADGALFIPSGNNLAQVSSSSDTLRQEPNKQIVIPQHVWNSAGEHALGRGDVLLLEVTERVNGVVHGPIKSHITIAPGALHGSVYYNTCWSGTSTTSNTGAGVGSMVMRIPRGGKAMPVTPASQCLGCHSVSVNGERLVAQRAAAIDDFNEFASTGKYPVYAWSAQLGPDGLPSANTHFGTMGSYGALYPDGSKYLTTSGNAGIVRWATQVVPPSAAVLLDSETGIAVSSTGIPSAISMPMFSPDGTRLVFNDTTLGNGHGLATMNYDTLNHQASGYKPLMQSEGGGDVRPGWPFFLPDNDAVVFLQTTSPDFTSSTNVWENHAANAAANDPNADPKAGIPSDLYIADVATGTVTILAKAMGYDTPADAKIGETYLPFGEADLHRNYFPTVLPVASGGYFWIFFDSLRHFGSLGAMRSLWAAAIDIHPDGSYTTDPSHPPFYLPGQEFISSSHHRVFATLDKCKPDGDKCTTGIDCCGGRCGSGTCSPPPEPPPPGEAPRCALREDRCETKADCCDPTDYCINNFCAFVELL